MPTSRYRTFTNWGAYEVESDGVKITAVHPFAKDPSPSEIGQSLKAVRSNRIAKPSIRESWYRLGPGSNPERRGWEPFVEVEWDEALDVLAAELDRIRTQFGNEAIFGGSYGWASAGRFHHAQSQIHRFLNSIGGYTYSVNSYSLAAGEVIIPHIFGMSSDDFADEQPSFSEIAENTELVVAFGGLPLKNSQVHYGGQGRHLVPQRLETCAERGVRFVNISPLREDLSAVDAEWIPLRPSTDVALMLGLAYSLVVADDHDADFLASHCHGWDTFREYLLGEADGIAKSAEWASHITGVDRQQIKSLAAEMAKLSTLITVSWSVQRTDHGEYSYWAAAALAAILGQIGRPGVGVGYGYAATGLNGHGVGHHDLPTLPQGVNKVDNFIPVARVSDMLLGPNTQHTYNGRDLEYPDTRLVYWAGGNPFHHHQDLNRLAKAWQRPETIVVHEPFWNTLAKYADFALPATTTLEREDIGGASMDDFIFWMDRVIEPFGDAKSDYEIFSELASRLGVGDLFTEGRTASEWLEHLYERFAAHHPEYPSLSELRVDGHFQIPESSYPDLRRRLIDFREDPDGSPLQTPSGKIEIRSATIEAFGDDDSPPYPAWIEPGEWLGNATDSELHLISNQPATRLHSQLDHGETSMKGKVDGREPIRIARPDADARGLKQGDTARVFNDRGGTLAVVEIRDDLMPGVVQMFTGAWWDPTEPGGLCRSGNPNVLTRDKGTSPIAQGTSAQTCLVEVEPFDDVPPRVAAHDRPELISS